jgi:hypothetical protein
MGFISDAFIGNFKERVPSPKARQISSSSNGDLQNSVKRTARLVLEPELSVTDMHFTHTSKTDNMKRKRGMLECLFLMLR